MARSGWGAIVAVVAIGGCAQPPLEQQVLEVALNALGGRGAIEAITTLSLEGEGVRGNLGQDLTPDATGQSFAISDYRQTLDIPAGRARVEETRTPNYLYFRGPDPIRRVGGIDGDVAYDVAPDGSATRASNAVASERRRAFYWHPVTVVRAALDPSALLFNPRSAPGESLVDVATADGLELTLALDASTHLPTRVSSMASHPNLRDVTYHVRFDDYEDVDGVKLPATITVFIDEFQLTRLEIASQTINGDVGDLSAPEGLSAEAPISGPPPANVTVEEVANGVWFLAGQSHHSVLVELSDHTLLIEAPNEVRALAVIAKARELVPDKPLTYLVSTHHHFDHSGGVRAAISEGLAVITQAANASFYEELSNRQSRIEPDALARNPQAARIEAVEDAATHGDGSMTVELYLVADNPHCEAMLMAYLPRHRLLVEADAFSPGGDYQPFAANLLENIQSRGLRVDRILPIHGGIVPYSALVDAVEAMTN